VKFPNVQSTDVKDILDAYVSHPCAYPLLSIMSSIFANVKMRALVQSIRFYVFTIVDSLLSTHLSTLKEMGSTFLSGYVNLAVGEKDPRNLMLAFAIARVVLVEFDTSAHTEVCLIIMPHAPCQTVIHRTSLISHSATFLLLSDHHLTIHMESVRMI
jgi:DNA repair/transcription protein MET18/MMS19